MPAETSRAGRGSRPYRRIVLALFFAGFATFSLLYCIQPALPELARDFGVAPAESSLALSLTTGALAVALLGAEIGAGKFGRRELMFAALCCAALMSIAEALLPGWYALLAARTLEGVALGGVPAIAMAYVSEHIDPRGLGLAMGLYVAGTAFGGMMGRVAMGAITQLSSWRTALGLIGTVDLAMAVTFFVLLPPTHERPPSARWPLAEHLRTWGRHLRRPGLPALLLVGTAALGAFITLYNYSAFRLVAAPYGLSQTDMSLVFVCYLLGMASSALGGALADRIGPAPVLIAGVGVTGAGLAMTLLSALAWVIAGIATVTFGFFMVQSIASSWVGRRAAEAKGHATSLYLLGSYVGSSVMGWLGGWFWLDGGWNAVAGFIAVLLVIALAAALRLRVEVTQRFRSADSRLR